MWIILGSSNSFAFISDSATSEYETSTPPCTLRIVGNLFKQFGYGLALPKGSPYTEMFTLAILRLRSDGEIEKLIKTWLRSGQCSEKLGE